MAPVSPALVSAAALPPLLEIRQTGSPACQQVNQIQRFERAAERYSTPSYARCGHRFDTIVL
ncbi:MAG: hypothetical protein HY060_14690 [Proteobacteria bacterium]|nr:hypothetical protein [Pseudomonadota bacterium]